MTTPTAPSSATNWLEELEALEARATKPPWVRQGSASMDCDVESEAREPGGAGYLNDGAPLFLAEIHCHGDSDAHADGDLIAALRNAAPCLLAIAKAAHEFTTANRLADSALLGWLHSPDVNEPATEVDARDAARDAALVALEEALAGGGE